LQRLQKRGAGEDQTTMTMVIALATITMTTAIATATVTVTGTEAATTASPAQDGMCAVGGIRGGIATMAVSMTSSGGWACRSPQAIVFATPSEPARGSGITHVLLRAGSTTLERWIES
jgi:hypothetical protein